MKKLLLSCAAMALSMTAFADEVVLFEDNFEWLLETNILTYESNGKLTSDNVGDKMYSGAYNPQSTTLKTPDGKTVWDLLTEKGYNMYSTTEAQAKKSVGCAKNYIKMAVTTYTAKLALPAMPAAGAGMENVHISFDWTPMTDGGKAEWDPTEICVEIENNGQSTIIAIPKANKENGWIDGIKDNGAITPYEWIKVDVVSPVAINKDTRISLRNSDPNYPQVAEGTATKQRWFIDNIKVYAGSASVGEIAVDENAPVEYYNLQGVKVANPENGIFICRQGSKTSKVVMK